MSADGLAKVHKLRPRRQRWWSQWPLGIVLLGVALSLIIVALDRFRVGSVLLAGSVVLAFVLRLVLPPDRIGLLAVRSRTVDLVVLGSLSLALVVFSLWVPPPT